MCGCDADCWCRTTRLGRLVKWWFPARRFGIRHKNIWFETTFEGWSDDEIRAWKREQDRRPPEQLGPLLTSGNRRGTRNPRAFTPSAPRHRARSRPRTRRTIAAPPLGKSSAIAPLPRCRSAHSLRKTTANRSSIRTWWRRLDARARRQSGSQRRVLPRTPLHPAPLHLRSLGCGIRIAA